MGEGAGDAGVEFRAARNEGRLWGREGRTRRLLEMRYLRKPSPMTSTLIGGIEDRREKMGKMRRRT